MKREQDEEWQRQLRDVEERKGKRPPGMPAMTPPPGMPPMGGWKAPWGMPRKPPPAKAKPSQLTKGEPAKAKPSQLTKGGPPPARLQKLLRPSWHASSQLVPKKKARTFVPRVPAQDSWDDTEKVTLPIASCLLPVAYCLLPIAYCLYCLLSIAYCAYCLLPIAYCGRRHLMTMVSSEKLMMRCKAPETVMMRLKPPEKVMMRQHQNQQHLQQRLCGRTKKCIGRRRALGQAAAAAMTASGAV